MQVKRIKVPTEHHRKIINWWHSKFDTSRSAYGTYTHLESKRVYDSQNDKDWNELVSLYEKDTNTKIDL